MRYRVFLDTNLLLSGIFFDGNESKVLDLLEIDLVTCEDVVNELYKAINEKLKYLKGRTFEIALSETERALSDIEIIPQSKYQQKLRTAENFITHKKDIPILATVFYARPDYFLTGDSHFFTDKIKNIVKVMTARDFLEEIKKG